MIRLGIFVACEMKENERSGSVTRKKEMISYQCLSMFSKNVPLRFSRSKENAVRCNRKPWLCMYTLHR